MIACKAIPTSSLFRFLSFRLLPASYCTSANLQCKTPPTAIPQNRCVTEPERATLRPRNQGFACSSTKGGDNWRHTQRPKSVGKMILQKCRGLGSSLGILLMLLPGHSRLVCTLARLCLQRGAVWLALARGKGPFRSSEERQPEGTEVLGVQWTVPPGQQSFS